ncbi:MAG TPA: hypothetical protein VGK70_06965 [Thermoanaerobaculia bacterium]|jgi:hypothetical protein
MTRNGSRSRDCSSLPLDYDRNPALFYPVDYELGHFSIAAPRGFGESVETKPGADEREKAREGTERVHGGMAPMVLSFPRCASS